MIDYEFTNAVVKKVVGSFKSNYTSLRKMLTELLLWLHVPFYDECCPVEGNPLPVGIINNYLSYYNSFEWVNYSLVNTTVVTIDVTNINNYITNNLFIQGQAYKIVNVHPPLYGGTDVYLLALETNVLSHSGVGVFYHPTYDQTLADFGIWNNVNTWTSTLLTGRFPANALITANNGAVGNLFGDLTGNKFIATSGDFTTATSITYTTPNITTPNVTSSTTTITANTANLQVGMVVSVVSGTGAFAPGTTISWIVSPTQFIVSVAPTTPIAPFAVINASATASISAVTLKTYALASKVIWGGKYWLNLTGQVGTAPDCLNLDAVNWQVVPYSATDYNVVYDTVEVDLPNNIIVMRQDLNGNKVVTTNDDIAVFAAKNYHAVYDHPINVMQWGNPYIDTTSKGCSNNVVTNGYAESINHIGCFVNNNVESRSVIQGNKSVTGQLKQNILTNSSEIRLNTLTESSSITTNLLDAAGLINNNNLGNASSILNNKVYFSEVTSNNLIIGGFIYSNFMNNRSFMIGNIFYGQFSQIRYNNLFSASGINNNLLNTWNFIHGNDLSNTYFNTGNTTQISGNNLSAVSTSSSSANIVRNTLKSASQINNNLMTVANTNISSNYLDGGSRTIISKINLNTISVTLTDIIGCRLIGSQLLNCPLSTNSLSGMELDRIVYDCLSIPVTAPIRKINVSVAEGYYNFTTVFSNAAGSGAIGKVTLPYFLIPTGYFISEVLVDVGAGLSAGAGAYLTLGIEGDNVSAGLDATSGLVTTLNGFGITRVFNPVTTRATVNRALEINVGGAAITGGTIGIFVRINKLI